MKINLSTEPLKTVAEAAAYVGVAEFRLLELLAKTLDDYDALGWDTIPAEHAHLLNELKAQLNGTEATEAPSIPSDDEILDLAERSNCDLDVVMQAAANIANLEELALYIEAYQELAAKAHIQEAAKQQFEIDQLQKKGREAEERVLAATSRKKPDTVKIQKQLGVKVSGAVTNLAQWNGNTGGQEPDFLKTARAMFTQNQAT